MIKVLCILTTIKEIFEVGQICTVVSFDHVIRKKLNLIRLYHDAAVAALRIQSFLDN